MHANCQGIYAQPEYKTTIPGLVKTKRELSMAKLSKCNEKIFQKDTASNFNIVQIL